MGVDSPKPSEPGRKPAAWPLVGARVRRVDAPSRELFALTLGSRGQRGVLLLGIAPGARGVGLVPDRPRGAPADGFVRKLRTTLEGGRLCELEATDRGMRLEVQARGQRLALELDLGGGDGNVRLVDNDGVTLARLHRVDPRGRAPRIRLPADLDELAHAGTELLQRWQRMQQQALRYPLARALDRAIKRLRRRLVAIQGDRQRIEEVDGLRARASLLLANLHRLAPDASTVDLEDTSVVPTVHVQLELPRGVSPRVQAERWFERARKLERGGHIAGERAQLTRTTLAELEAIATELTSVEEPAQLHGLRERARAAGVEIGAVQRPRARASRTRLPYRTFEGDGGRAILVGRGAADNDRLTTRHARAQDLWLHARDSGGAHVVVPLERGESCPPSLLADAATLAAHFSQSRGEARVDVSYVERRHVRKPRKAPVGTILLDREKVIRLELEPARLARLLARERGRHGGS